MSPYFNDGGEGLFLRADRPGGGRLRWTSNLNWGLHSNRGVGFIRLFARLERGGSTAIPVPLLWSQGGIMVFAVSRVTPIPPPRTPIDRTLRPSPLITAPIISTLRFCALFWFPASAGRALGFPVRQPCFEILFFGHRIHIMRHQYVLSRCAHTWSKQASHLRRRLREGQCVA